VRHFIVFEDEGGGKLVKKMAGYHQFHAVNLVETKRGGGELTRGGREKRLFFLTLVRCGRGKGMPLEGFVNRNR